MSDCSESGIQELMLGISVVKVQVLSKDHDISWPVEAEEGLEEPQSLAALEPASPVTYESEGHRSEAVHCVCAHLSQLFGPGLWTLKPVRSHCLPLPQSPGDPCERQLKCLLLIIPSEPPDDPTCPSQRGHMTPVLVSLHGYR